MADEAVGVDVGDHRDARQLSLCLAGSNSLLSTTNG